MYKSLLSVFVVFFLLACDRTPEPSQNSVTNLATDLQALDKNIPFNQALSLSKEIFQQTEQLREKFNPVSEPHVNNFLINIGVKEQGLCYQWSDALYLYFKKRDYAHFSFHLLVADKGKYWSEHNVMVVAVKGGNVMDGVLIDPWRNPESLYFSKVKDDRAYQWVHRAERGCRVK